MLKPFWPNGPTLPMAMYVSSNQIEFTENARINAKNHLPGYYDDVLSFLRKDDSIDYLGKSCQYRDMIKIGIENKLPYLFNDILFINGGLEKNRASMPIVFIFQPDIQSNEASFILNLFDKAGYGNFTTLDLQKLIVEQNQQLTRTDKLLVLSSDKKKLYAYLFDSHSGSLLASKSYDDMGEDPRVTNLVKAVFSSINQDPRVYNFDKDAELPGITGFVERFIASGRNEIYDEEYVLSDGQVTYINVDRLTVRNLLTGLNVDMATTIQSFLKSNGAAADDTTIALTRYARTDYFEKTFQSMFRNVLAVDDDEINNRIVGFIQKHDYNFTKKPKDNKRQLTTSTVSSKDKLLSDVRTLIDGYKGRNDYDALLKEANDLFVRLQTVGIREFDVKVHKVIDFAKVGIGASDDDDPPSDSTTKNSRKFTREVNVLMRGYLRRADYLQLLKEANDLLARLHAENVHDFDADMQKVLAYAKAHIKPPGDPKKFTREVNVLKRGYRQRADSDRLLGEAEGLLNRMHAANVHDYDADLQEVIEYARNSVERKPVSQTSGVRGRSQSATTAPPAKATVKAENAAKSSTAPGKSTDTTPKSSANEAKYRRDVNIMYRGYKNRSDHDVLRKDVEALLKKLHDEGITSYDEKLNEILSFSKSAAANSGTGTAPNKSGRVFKPVLSSAYEVSDPEASENERNSRAESNKDNPNTAYAAATSQTMPGNSEHQGAATPPSVKSQSKMREPAEISPDIPTQPIQANAMLLKERRDVSGKSFDEDGMKFRVGKDGDVSVNLSKCKGDVIVPQVVKIGDVTLYVTSIVEGGFFSTCTDVNSVILPATLVRLGGFALSFAAIRSIELPPRLKSIGDYAFNSCKFLRNLVIPETVKSVGDHAFDGCKSLRLIQFNGEEFWNDAISGCKSLEVIRFTCAPPTVKGKVDSWKQFFDKVELQVPISYATDYKKDPIWSRFKKIVTYTD